jgi:hypothetical protein
MRTDNDEINRSYLMKDSGEIELIKKDNENIDKKDADDKQKSLSNHS